MAENINSISNEIADLERRLAEKKAALESEPHSPETIKEEAHTLVGEKITTQAPAYPVKPPVHATDEKSYEQPGIKEEVDKLIAIAETNLEQAIKEVVATGNEAIIDAFHDKISDELTQHLIQSGRLADL